MLSGVLRGKKKANFWWEAPWIPFLAPPNGYQEDSGAEEVIDGRTSHKIKGEKKKIEALLMSQIPIISHWLMQKEGLEGLPLLPKGHYWGQRGPSWDLRTLGGPLGPWKNSVIKDGNWKSYGACWENHLFLYCHVWVAVINIPSLNNKQLLEFWATPNCSWWF